MITQTFCNISSINELPNKFYFVDFGKDLSGNGSIYNPFNNLEEANDASLMGDTIKILSFGEVVGRGAIFSQSLELLPFRTYDFSFCPCRLDLPAGADTWIRFLDEGMYIIKDMLVYLESIPNGFMSIGTGQLVNFYDSFINNVEKQLVSAQPGILISGGAGSAPYNFYPGLWSRDTTFGFGSTSTIDFDNTGLEMEGRGAAKLINTNISVGTLSSCVKVINNAVIEGVFSNFRNRSIVTTFALSNSTQLISKSSNIQNASAGVALSISGNNCNISLLNGTVLQSASGTALSKGGASTVYVSPFRGSFSTLGNISNIFASPDTVVTTYPGNPDGVFDGNSGQITVNTSTAARYICRGGTVWQAI